MTRGIIHRPHEHQGGPRPTALDLRCQRGVINHEFEERIDKSVLRVTVWHQEALLSDAKE